MLLRVTWTAGRSNQSILKEISPEYSLETLMLKLKRQYFGHLMQRAISSSVIPFSSCPHSLPTSGSFPMNWLFESGWLKYWSFSFSISVSNEYSGLISFRMDWFYLLAVQGKKSSDEPRQCNKKQRHHFASKGPYHQAMVFLVVMNNCES